MVTQVTQRSSNFELLRILLIIFVVILHYNDSSRHGAFSFIDQATSLNKFFLYSMESLTLCAVNGFLCLSGYFLSKKDNVNIRKIIHLFTILFAYRVLTYLPAAIMHGSLSLKGLVSCFIPSSYYANLYCVVFLLSPFLNLITNKLNEKKYKLFIILLLSLFSILPTLTAVIPLAKSVSAISLYGNGRGFTIVNFILLYYIGGYIAKRDYKNTTISLLVFVLSSFLNCGIMFINKSAAIMYCNILVVLQAASLIVLFKNIKYQSNIVNSVAKSVWGVFCIHGFFLGIYCKMYPYELSQNFLHLVLHFGVCIIAVFACSLVWDKICTFVLKPIEKLFDRMPIFNKRISVE